MEGSKARYRYSSEGHKERLYYDTAIFPDMSLIIHSILGKKYLYLDIIHYNSSKIICNYKTFSYYSIYNRNPTNWVQRICLWLLKLKYDTKDKNWNRKLLVMADAKDSHKLLLINTTATREVVDPKNVPT